MSQPLATLLDLIENRSVRAYQDNGIPFQIGPQRISAVASSLQKGFVIRVTGSPRVKPARAREASADILAALRVQNLSFGFLVKGSSDQLSIYLSIFRRNAVFQNQNHNAEMQNVLECGYPWISSTVSSTRVFYELLKGQWHCALMTGFPMFKASSSNFGQVERIVRGMRGKDWWLLVFAEPVPEESMTKLKKCIHDQLYMNISHAVRSMQDDQGETEQIIDPIAKKYLDDLELQAQKLEEGERRGLWSCWFLIGSSTDSSLSSLQSICKGVYSGNLLRLEPFTVLRIRPDSGLASLDLIIQGMEQMNQRFLSNVVQDGFPPELFSSPRLKPLLPTSDVATIARLPTVETQGFSVEERPRFVADIPSRFICNRIE